MRCDCNQAKLELLAELLRWANRYQTTLGRTAHREVTAHLAIRSDVIKAAMPVKRRVLTGKPPEGRK